MTAPDSLTIFGTPFVDDGGALAVLAPDLWAEVGQLHHSRTWVCKVYHQGVRVVFTKSPRPGPHLLRKAEQAYRDYVRDLAAVAGLELSDD